jgi:hypothetical protein
MPGNSTRRATLFCFSASKIETGGWAITQRSSIPFGLSTPGLSKARSINLIPIQTPDND